MPYQRQYWENSPSTATPVSADNLNHMEAGIESAASRLNMVEAALFDPRSLPELRVWLDGRYPDGRLAPNIAGNSAVTRWEDLSGYSLDGQATSTGPTWQQAAIKGRPGLLYAEGTSGSSRLPSNTWMDQIDGITVYLVAYQDGTAEPNQRLWYTSNPGLRRFEVKTDKTGDLTVGGRRVGTDSYGSVTVSHGSPQTPQLFTGMADWRSGVFLGGINGQEDSASTMASTGVFDATDTDSEVGYGFYGWIGCVLAFTAAHDSATRRAVNSWLSHLWSIPLAG